MKKIQIIIGILGFLWFMSACEKDDTNPDNLDENTIVFKSENYNANGYLTKKSEVDSVNTWKIEIRGQYETEQNTTTDAIVNSFSYFTINIELISIEDTSIEGTYNMGDQNGDGMVNKMDAFDAGVCTSANIKMDETYSFFSGELVLEEKTLNHSYYNTNDEYISDSKTKGFSIQFSLTDTNNQILIGNADLIDSRN